MSRSLVQISRRHLVGIGQNQRIDHATDESSLDQLHDLGRVLGKGRPLGEPVDKHVCIYEDSIHACGQDVR